MLTRVSFLFVVLLVAAGCGSSAPATETTVRQPNPGGNAQMAQSRDTRAAADTGAQTCSPEPVYFAFDSADLDSSSRERLGRSARCISQRSSDRVVITGMTDPRGTEEYNLALGDRRARTVAGYVESLGVEQGKIRTTSVGEEMAAGADESGWSRDRRAEIQTP